MILLHDAYPSLSIPPLRRRLILTIIAIITFLFVCNRLLHLSTPGEQVPISLGSDVSAVSSFQTTIYKPGIPKAPGQPYTRTLVIARTLDESITWLTGDYDLTHDSHLSFAIYTVDDEQSTPNVPINKGHEVMPYLTHIITNYADLADVTLFMHAHRWTWHNNDLLNSDAKVMIQSLSSEKVVRDGYMNLRCHLDPGCPDHIHPSRPSEGEMDQLNRPEEAIVGMAWLELFPEEKAMGPPRVLSQPCCAQFALSRERIHAVPLEKYVFFRQWLMNTTLEDRLSGRVWEYVWQYVFAGVHEFCPEEHVCYCDGYGVCFGGKTEFENWFSIRAKWRNMLKERDTLGDEAVDSKEKITAQMDALQDEMDRLKANALERGKNPQNRASEAERSWATGDGF